MAASFNDIDEAMRSMFAGESRINLLPTNHGVMMGENKNIEIVKLVIWKIYG